MGRFPSNTANFNFMTHLDDCNVEPGGQFRDQNNGNNKLTMESRIALCLQTEVLRLAELTVELPEI